MSAVLPSEGGLSSLREYVDLDKYYLANLQWRRLGTSIERCVSLAGDLGDSYSRRLRDGVADYLARRVCWFYQKTFVYELHRHTGGAESEQAFEDFVRHLADEGVQEEIALRYAPLTERVDKFLLNFESFVAEHCRHWRADREMLASAGFAASVVPDAIQFGLGDPHRGARSSIALTFGADKLYYKPRSLDLDLLFVAVQRRIAPWMKGLETIDRGSYGWQRGVAPACPEGKTAADLFFRHVGSATAVLHLLSGSDFHYENIVSDEDGAPFFVDMEALFTHRDFSDSVERDPVPRTSAERRFQGQIKDSIFSIGLVPYSQAREGGFAGLAENTQVAAPVSSEVAVDEKRGNMRLARKSVAMTIDSAVPKIDGRPASPSEHIDALVAGFTDAMQLAMDHRAEILSILGSGQWRSRQIYRNTYVYYLFLAETTHPLIAGDPGGFDRLMRKLAREHEMKPFLSRTFEAEIAEMHAFDVPSFSAAAGGTSVAIGGQEFEGFFASSVMSAVQRRIGALDDAYVLAQAELLRRAYCKSAPTSLSPGPSESSIMDLVDVLRTTCTMGTDGNSLTWRYSPPADPSGQKVAVTTMGPDIYSGMAGMVWFLSEAALAVRDPELQRFYELARTSAENFLGKRLQYCQPGALTGYHGLLWVLCNDALRHGRDDLWNAWRERLCQEEAYAAISSCDVVDGLAGCVLQLVSLYRLRPEAELLTLAGRLVERMLAAATRDDAGMSWRHEAMQRPLLGFGHGGAGVACAVHAYAEAAGDGRLQAVVADIFRFEDSHFNVELGLWPDLRADHPSFTTSWCNGLAGHVLARVLCWDVLTEQQRSTTRTAAETLLRYAEDGVNDSLCHGVLGNVEALEQAARVLGDERMATAAVSVLAAVGERGSFRSGWEPDPSNLGIHVGVAGYGMSLLRRRDPAVCSPLSFWSRGGGPLAKGGEEAR